LRSSLLAGSVLERLDHHPRERQGDVADPEVDQADAGVRVAMRLGAPLDLGEEIARPQVEERLVDPGHVSPPSPVRGHSIRSRRVAPPASRLPFEHQGAEHITAADDTDQEGLPTPAFNDGKTAESRREHVIYRGSYRVIWHKRHDTAPHDLVDVFSP
jgi:hypothetical protein